MKTKVVIEIETIGYKCPDKEDGENMVSETEFHEAIRNYIDDLITDNDDFESDVLDRLNDNYGIEADEFQKFGGLSIKVQHLGSLE